MMRTTVTLDPDVEVIIRNLMKSRGVGFKVALNEAVRGGAGSPMDIGFTSPTFALGEPAVALDKALKLAGDLEDQELLAKLRRDS